MVVSLAVLAAAIFVAAPAYAESAPDSGRAFRPDPASKALYGSKPPSANPKLQQHYVEAHDGVDIYVETWLPAKQGRHVPPKEVPTILIMTPYASIYGPLNSEASFIEYMNARGYAVAMSHVRGTGNSGGCLEQTSVNQIDDGARVIEYLGRDAKWSNGRVGMYGASYDAETQISTAGLGDPDRIK